ncbi:MAG: hypothetical protein QM586_04605 [Xenophilus sp.]
MDRMRPYWLACLFAGFLSPSAAFSQPDRIVLELHPAPGITAHIINDGHRVTLKQPQGEDIDLPDPENRLDRPDPSITRRDVDFDGHDDLIVRYPGRPADEAVQVVRYRPELRSYRVLTAPDTASQPMLCGMQAIRIDVSSRELHVHCREGDALVMEGLRFDAQGRSWLALRKIEAATPASSSGQSPDFSRRQTGVFGEITRWNAKGHEIEARAYSARGTPIEATVRAARASLYSAPSDQARTAAYLIGGDKVRVLAQQGHWLRIAYEGKAGRIDRWIDTAAFSAPDEHALP